MQICNNCAKETTTKCSRCLNVYYCSRECQIACWTTHKTNCNKQIEKPCNNCAKPSNYYCGGCDVGYYCNEICQTRHWEVHQVLCKSASMPLLNENKNPKKNVDYEPKQKPMEENLDVEEFVKIGITFTNCEKMKINKKFNVFKQFTFDGFMPKLDLEKPIECCFCLNNVNTEYDLCIASCSHGFHYDCMIEYEKKGNNFNCPLCRKDLTPEIQKFNNANNEILNLSIKNIKRVFDNYLELSKGGSKHAQLITGTMYFMSGIAKFCSNPNKEGLKWIYISAHKEYKFAYQSLMVYFCKIGNWDHCLYWLTKLADIGDIESQNNLAIIYRNGKGRFYYLDYDVPIDFDKSLKYCKMAADNGDVNSQYIYHVLTNDMKYLIMAANENYPDALCNYACCYVNGTGGIKKNLKKAFELFHKAADMGHVMSQHELGKCYLQFNKDYDNAYLWFKKASDYGNIEATYYVGLLYLIGNKHIQKDINKAILFLKKSYDRGLKHSNEELGSIIGMVHIVKLKLKPEEYNTFDYFEFDEFNNITVIKPKKKEVTKLIKKFYTDNSINELNQIVFI